MRLIKIVYVLILFVKVNSLTCGEEEFACKDGKRCISKNYICNDYTNCLDDSDEDAELCKDWEYDYNFDSEDYEGKEFFEIFGLGNIGEQFGVKTGDGKSEETEVDEEESKEINQEEEFLEPYEDTEGDQEFCSLIKCNPHGVLSFRSDHEYNYEYNLEITTEASSDNKQQAKVLINSNVTLLGLTACELTLKISGVEIFTSDPGSGGSPVKQIYDEYFKKEVMKNELRFSMDGGTVHYVCAKDTDVRIINFKKGIISMFQNSMPVLHISHHVIEKDVTGECPTYYSFVDGNEASTLVSRSKDLDNCRDRTYLHSATNGVPYEFPAGMQSIPVVNSTTNCQQEIKKGVIQSVNCMETHSLTPFNSDSSSISTSIIQKLVLKDEKFDFLHIGKVYSRSDIIFDHRGSTQSSREFNSETDNSDNVAKLKSYIDSANNNGQKNHIGTIMRILKSFSVRDFEILKSDELWEGIYRNTFHEALSFVNTKASVAFMVKEMKEFKPEFHISWLRGFGKIPSPDLFIIKELAKLLEYKNLPSETYLHIGSVINGHCVRYPGCGLTPIIYNALKEFQLAIADNCYRTTSEDKLKVLMVLKGIGNAGIAVSDEMMESLSQCYLNDDNTMEIRAAAITAFRRIPCSASRAQLEQVFANQLVDAELRILAYMEIMRCPNYRVVKKVRNLLANEEVNQVGSFVWTHLKNLQGTGMPSKLLVQSLLSDQELEDKFNHDVRKFSRFIEWSAYYDDLNIGASLESSIIFSQKSYIPRLTTVNLTADLFGRSINFLEFGARIDGLDKYIEQFLLGFFNGPPKDEKDTIQNEEITDLISQTTRGEEYLDKEVELSLSMKTFGNDMYYGHFEGEADLMKFRENLDPMKMLFKDMKKGKKFNLQRSTMPMSGVYYLSTSAGFSLGINIDAIASVDVSSQLELDIWKLFMTKRGVVKGKLEPTLDIDLSASMTLDTITSMTGIEFTGKLHTSSSINGQAEVDGYKMLNFDINLPKKEINVFDISARLMLVHGTSDGSEESLSFTREEVGNYKAREDSQPTCTSFQQEIGVEFCYIWNFPNTNELLTHISLLNGPIRAMGVVKKKEHDLISYKFRYEWIQTEEQLSFILLLDTPGTSVSREHAAKFILDYVNKSALFLIKTPKTTVNIKGKYIWKPNEKRFDSTIRVNGMSGSAIIGYKIASKSSQSTLLPSVIIVWDANEVIRVGGSLEAIQRKSGGKGDSTYYAVDLRYDVDIGGKYDGKITGYVNVKRNEWEVSLEIPYSIQSSRTEPVKEKILIEYTKIMKHTESVNKYVRNWKIIFTQFPNLNMKGRLTSKKYFGLMENELQIGFGIGYELPVNQVIIYQYLVLLRETSQSTFNSTIAIKYPKQDLDLIIGLDFFNDRSELNSGFVFQYASGKAVTSRVHLLKISSKYGNPSSNPLNIELDLHLIIPELLNFLFECSTKEVNTDEYQFQILASLSESAHIEIEGIYSDHSTSMNSLHNLELEIKLPDREIIYVNTTILQNPTEIAFHGQLTMTPDYPYTLRIAYIKEKDDFLVLERRLEVDFKLPKRLYYWHVKYALGEFITISNVIHFDVYRDVILWIQMPLDTEKSRSIEVKLYWDANRDPHKKATAKVVLTNQSFNYSGSLFILDNEYTAFWTTSKHISHTDMQSNYKYNTEGFIHWKDSTKQLYELSTGLSFHLQRGAEAELIYKGYLITPFSDWEDNWFKLEYARNVNRVSASLLSQWHDGEFINVKAHSSKLVLSDVWEIESVVDINSSLEGLINAKAEGSVQKITGKMVAKGLIKWEQDILQFVLEAENNSGPNDVRLSLSAVTTTTLPGFTLMKANFDFITAKGILDVYGAIKWDNALYELKTRGLIFTKDEFLLGELRLSTPDYGTDTAVIFLRVFKDMTGMHDKLDVIAKWYSKEISLSGEISSIPGDIKLKLVAATPFEIFKHGSISVAHNSQKTYKTEAEVNWNGVYSAGFLVEAYFNSLLDFLIKLELETPFSQFQIVKAEIKNIYLIGSEALIRSRIFTQLNEYKFGIGGRLEQASEPRLRVSLELYTPSPELEEAYFDIAYNSTTIGKHFLLSMGHGKQKHINLRFLMKNTEQSLELELESDVEVPILGEEYAKMSIDFGGKLFWMTSRDLRVNLLATTISRTFKITTKGSLFPGGGGSITGELDFPYETLQNLDFSGEYLLAAYPSNGYAIAKLQRHSNKDFEFALKGNIRDLTIKIISPSVVLRDANFHYEMIAYDVKRSKLRATGSLNGEELSIDSMVILDSNNYIKKIEGEINTSPYGSYKVSATGDILGDKYINVFQLTRSDKKYYLKLLWKYDSVQEWDLDFQLYENSMKRVDIVSGKVLLHDVASKPLRIAANMKTPEDIYEIDFSARSQKRPYESSFSWEFPGGAGKLTVQMGELSKEKISTVAILETDIPDEPHKQFTLTFDLFDHSPNADINVDVDLGYTTAIGEHVNTINLNGTLRQVTENPGLIALQLKWPNSDPIVLKASASYGEAEGRDVYATLDMQLPNCSYGFNGKVNKEKEKLSSTSVIWWRKFGFHKEEIVFNGEFVIKNDQINAHIDLSLPFLEGKQTAILLYTKTNDGMNISGYVIIMEKEIEVEISYTPKEGYAIVKSESFWNGNSLTINYKQTVSSERIIGIYSLEWPRYNNKISEYEILLMEAKLNHSFLKFGHNGTLHLTLPVSQDNTLILDYGYEFPAPTDIILMVHVNFGLLQFGIEGSDVLTKTDMFNARKTEVKLYNDIWPIAAAYIYQTYFNEDKVKEKLSIYQLKDVPDKSQVIFLKESHSQGRKLNIDANFGSRQVKYTTGYRYTPTIKNAEFSLTWGKSQGIIAEVSLQDESQTASEERYNIVGRLGNILQLIELQGEYLKNQSGLHTSFNYDWNVYDDDNDLIEMTFYLRNLSTDGNPHFSWNGEINHETLEVPLMVEGEFEKHDELLFSTKFLLHYSKSPAHDFHLDAYITKQTTARNMSNLIIISHPSSSLYAETRGSFGLIFPKFNFDQLCLYTDTANHSSSARVIGEADVLKRNINLMINTTYHRVRFHVDPEANKSEIVGFRAYTDPSIWQSNLNSYSSLPIFIITLENFNPNTSKDRSKTAIEDPTDLWLAKKVLAEGGIEDQREVYFRIRHLQESNFKSSLEHDDNWIQDADMFFKLNHSRLLSSQLRWKNESLRTLMGNSHIASEGVKQSMISVMSHVFRIAFDETSARIGPIVNELRQTLSPFMEEFKNNSIKYRDNFVESFTSTKLTAKEQEYFASVKLLYDNTVAKILSLEIVQKLRSQIITGTFNQQIATFINKITESYQYLMENELSTEDVRKSFNAILMKLAQYYDNTVKEFSRALRSVFSDFNEKLQIWLRNKWHSIYHNYKPHILKTAHMIESGLFDVLERISKTTKALQDAFKSVSYLSYLQKVYTTFYVKYKQFSERSVKENLEILCDYVYVKVINGFKSFADKVFPFMKDWMENLNRAWKKLNKFENIRNISNFLTFIYDKITACLDRLDIKDKILTSTAFLLSKGNRILSQTSIDAELRNIKVKTFMEWSPSKGEIIFQQKLPLVWRSFNQTPAWSKLFEISLLTKIKGAFMATDYSLLDYWYKHININFSPWNMLPPFQAKAYYIGNNNIITFDGRHLRLEGDCEHLLAADLVYKQWAITVNRGYLSSKTINIFVYGKKVELSMNYKVKIDNRFVGLPRVLGSTLIWRTAGSIHLRHSRGFHVSWNIAHDVLIVSVPGTSFLNTAGVLGTNNNEPMDDMVSPEGKLFAVGDERNFFNSWNISSGNCLTKKIPVQRRPSNFCEDSFVTKLSPYKHCFYHVSPIPFYGICRSQSRGKREDMCSVSLAYRDSCKEHNIHLKLPTFCVKCSYHNETTGQMAALNEGEAITVKRQSKSTEVVLVVELSSCNKKRLQGSIFTRFIKAFNKGLQSEGFTSVRYTVVAYGGSGMMDEATLVSKGSDLFVDAEKVATLMKHLKFGKSSWSKQGSAFSAINFASKLNFRPATKQAILLFSCSPCAASNKFDYSTMYHIIESSDMNLVVFKEGFFSINKSSMKKKIIGYDEKRAYTLKDSKRHKPGKKALQHQINSPKKELGYCYPLAIETGGSIFSSEFLRKSKKKADNLGMVVGRTVGLLPEDISSERCLCMSSEEITPLMRCDQWKHGDYTILEKYGLKLDKSIVPNTYRQKDELELNFYAL